MQKSVKAWRKRHFKQCKKSKKQRKITRTVEIAAFESCFSLFGLLQWLISQGQKPIKSG